MDSLGLPAPDTLTLEQQVAQLIVVRAAGTLLDHQRRYPQWELSHQELHTCVAELGVGGVILLGGTAPEVGLRSQQLQTWAKIPLLIAADIEEGVGQRFPGATPFPPPLALEAIAATNPDRALTYAEEMGAITAQEALAIGINWLLAPVVDVNSNPHNPVINVRAFGQTTAGVSQRSCRFIAGAQRFPVLTTAKHFPGHGNTAVDSHLQLPVIAQERAGLDQVELPPFQAAIAAGVDAIMTAHLQVPALDPQYPATLSAPILTQLLRQELGFGGLVVTDALVMGAITQHYGPYEAAVLALEAGADILLMPSDPVGTVAAVCEAVRVGRLSRDRILTSVERLWRAKQKVAPGVETAPGDSHQWEALAAPLPLALDQLATPAATQLATAITQASMAQRDSIPPCPPDSSGYSLIVVDEVLGMPWLSAQAPALTLPARHGYQPRLVDEAACTLTPGSFAPGTLLEAPTLLQVFSRGNPFRGRAAIGALALDWFYTLRDQGQLMGLVVYGSPYTWERLRPELPRSIPYGFTYSQTPLAQALLLEALLGPVAAPVATATFTD